MFPFRRQPTGLSSRADYLTAMATAIPAMSADAIKEMLIEHNIILEMLRARWVELNGGYDHDRKTDEGMDL